MNLKKKFLSSKARVAVAFIAGAALAIGGSVLGTSIGTNLSVSGTATITGASTLTGVGTLTGGFVSQASSTMTGTLNVFAIDSATSTLFRSGFISNASSTVVGTLTTTGAFSASSTAVISGLSTLTGGHISQASSTVVGALTTTGLSSLGDAKLKTGGFISYASSTIINQLSIAGSENSSGNGNGMLAIGSSTPAQELSIAGDILANGTSTSATTTVTVASNGTNFGGCINLRATDGTMIRIYATSSPTAAQAYTNGNQGRGFEKLVVEAGACQ